MTSVRIVQDESALVQELASLVQDAANDAIKERGTFFIGVSGGSLVKFLSEGLRNVRTDWKKWRIFFCDERVVPEDDPESTFGIYRKNFAQTVGIEETQFVKIKQGVSAEEAAADYEAQLRSYFPNTSLPRFDILLLGMGPDGHTCSLFPGHKLLQETNRWIAPITDSPKPPACRVTMTLPVVNNAVKCVFAMAGAGKAEMVKKILVQKEDLPASKVKPTSGQLIWILDKEAGGSVSTNV